MKHKNHLSEVAEILGVRLDEPFRILKDGNFRSGVYKISANGIKYSEDSTKIVWRECNGHILAELIYGETKLFRLPWPIKKGDEYWSFLFDGSVQRYVWADGVFDNTRFLMGAVFATEKEAEAALPNFYKNYQKMEWLK